MHAVAIRTLFRVVRASTSQGKGHQDDLFDWKARQMQSGVHHVSLNLKGPTEAPRQICEAVNAGTTRVEE